MVGQSLECASCGAPYLRPAKEMGIGVYKCAGCGKFTKFSGDAAFNFEPEVEFEELEVETNETTENDEPGNKMVTNIFGGFISFVYVILVILFAVSGDWLACAGASFIFTVLYLGFGCRMEPSTDANDTGDMGSTIFALAMCGLYILVLILTWEWSLLGVVLAFLFAFLVDFVALIAGAAISSFMDLGKETEDQEGENQ